MTRRFVDMRLVRQEQTTGEAIVSFLSAVTAIVIVALILTFAAPYARADDADRWSNSDPIIRQWYRSLKQPDNPNVSCCGEGDAYWADEIAVEGDKVFAIITDTRPDGPLGRPHIPPGTRVEIPKHKYKFDAGNPTGHNVIFVGQYGSVYCFVQGSGT